MSAADDARYESKDGFSSHIWGCPLWHVLHIISLNYPVSPTQEDKQHYATFWNSLQYVLPCRVCRENFSRRLKIIPLSEADLKSRHSFARYVFAVHNSIPGRPPLPISFEQMRETLETFRSSCGPRGCVLPNNFVPSRALLHIVPISQHREDPSFRVNALCFEPRPTQEEPS